MILLKFILNYKKAFHVSSNDISLHKIFKHLNKLLWLTKSQTNALLAVLALTSARLEQFQKVASIQLTLTHVFHAAHAPVHVLTTLS